MESVSCGAAAVSHKKTNARILGITVRGLESINKCADDYLVMDYFFARKWLMINYSTAFVVFPGGFGTLEELTETITLMKTKTLPGVPIVLINVDYWKLFYTWLTDVALKHGLISQEDLSLIRVTDDLNQALIWIQEYCKMCENRAGGNH